jgi:hypothetical protein
MGLTWMDGWNVIIKVMIKWREERREMRVVHNDDGDPSERVMCDEQ